MISSDRKSDIKRISLFLNPLAGKGKSANITLQIWNKLKEKNIDFEVYESAWPETLNYISEAWIIGGDGTLNYFLNKYIDVSIPLAIFKGGTGNDFAWKLYGDINLQQQIERVLSSEPKAVDAAKCNGKIFINGIGIGFDGEVLKSIKAIRLLGGHLGYLWIVLQKIFSFKEKPFQIHFNDQVFNEKFLLVIITNSSRTGGGFMVSPVADVTDGKLNTVLCKPLSVLKRLLNLPLIERGKHLHKNFIVHTEVSSVNVLCDKSVFAQIDGELISGKCFDVTVLPKRFLFKY